MSKTRKFNLSPNLMIAATVFGLFTASAMADNVTVLDDTYAPPTTTVQETETVRTLGTLHQHDIPGGQQTQVIQETTTTAPATVVAPQQHMMLRGTADTAGETLQPVQAGNITYVTGGVGDEERDYLKSVSSEYNLRVMSATKDGAFSGDTQIAIKDAKGNALVNAPAGPLFFAKLPAGRYVIEATSNGQTKSQTITAGGKPALVHFGW